MVILATGLVLFFGTHLVPSFVGFRSKLVDRLGEGPYKGLYSLFSLVGLILIIYGKSKAQFHPVWDPSIWSRHLVIVVMIPATYLLVAADAKSNIKRYMRHPMLMGIVLWSGAHLAANGDLASIILFGSFLLYSLVAMISANIRGAIKQEKVYPIKRDLITLVISVVVYLVLIKYFHTYLIGIPIV